MTVSVRGARVSGSVSQKHRGLGGLGLGVSPRASVPASQMSGHVTILQFGTADVRRLAGLRLIRSEGLFLLLLPAQICTRCSLNGDFKVWAHAK